jgi:hypothetical protein
MKKVYVINIFINQYIFVTFDRIGSWFSKRGKIHQKEGKYTKKGKIPLPKWGKICQLAIKHTDIFHYKVLHNIPKLGFLV